MNGTIYRPLGALVPSMPFTVRSIAVIGPGIVGMPMAALLAHARIRIGTDYPARVVVVQRRSASSAWKIPAINSGRSPIGGIEPALDEIIRTAVEHGMLRATDDYAVCRDADVILVCVQTDRSGDAPDYGPLLEALHAVARELALRPSGNAPLIIIESTLAPSSLETVVRDAFREVGLEDGRDMYLGHSPNRVMPGRLVDRVSSADKVVAGLDPETPQRIAQLYSHIVTRGTLYLTNALTAEICKTLENAYRDVRIALAAEVVRYCDARDIDFYALREWVNGELLQRDLASFQPTAVPRGGMLIPTLGVGGHCLPKDGILLWWRANELGVDTAHSIILESRRINDESPAWVGGIAERTLRGLRGRSIALLGAAYRFNSDDARNSPTFPLAHALQNAGAKVRMHDPYVRSHDGHVHSARLSAILTADLEQALDGAELAIMCVAHHDYVNGVDRILRSGGRLQGIVDAANAYDRAVFDGRGVNYEGVGRGRRRPPADLCRIVYDAFRVVERGVANEVAALINVLNARYAPHDFARVRFEQLQQVVGTCATGCAIADPGPAARALDHGDFSSRLVAHAVAASMRADQSKGRRAPLPGAAARSHVRLADA
ncbi:MAG: nucleotide sugar dehydrogenase [Gemmatimonadaceae bacterium]